MGGALGKKSLALQTDCDTRWNSLDNCIEQVLEMKPVLDMMCSTDPDLQHLKFTPQEWEGLSQFHNFLKPFAVFTSKLSGSTNSFHNATTAYEAMITGLTKAYEQLGTHPAIKISIQPMMDKLCLYRDARLRKPDEVISYLTAPIAYKNTHIPDWWRLNATQFPNLAIASWAILAIPATSVPSECAFSAGGRICDNLRGSLKAGIIAAQSVSRSSTDSRVSIARRELFKSDRHQTNAHLTVPGIQSMVTKEIEAESLTSVGINTMPTLNLKNVTTSKPSPSQGRPRVHMSSSFTQS
ncbi:hypothetical protein CROQUDRAFT_87070 [Cronartium quercuum f. sp. fusiforme G11]|uniref:HAT C-terminal dimerisation domain-containing protein n=1 Tax=Cronartium quercuum f. sp. fusiforme G11 TaxID=708437 RepID=A0A9P6NS69_9BASI|nr:hypothetical protein CROQUDRAFT_87070 [Cronartium quercuum f. sp. fusiforme G11]